LPLLWSTMVPACARLAIKRLGKYMQIFVKTHPFLNSLFWRHFGGFGLNYPKSLKTSTK
jgi:hypothetical protein